MGKNPIKKWTEDLHRYFPKMTANNQQVHENVLNIAHHQEMQIKTTKRYHLTPVRMAIIKKTRNNKWWHKCGKKGTFLRCQQECQLFQPLRKTV